MLHRSLRLVLATVVALTGCNALLDVKDIYFDPNAPGGPVVDSSTDAPANGDEASTIDAGTDASTCFADLTKDAKNCGRCGHDCLNGACSAGKCQAAQLTTIAAAPLFNIVLSDQYIFVSTRVTLVTQSGGIWRIAKTGGAPELYANLRDAEGMGILGDQLYFAVDDSPSGGGAGQTGGLYSCPIKGAAPCVPTLIAPATAPSAIAVDQNRVFYGDDDTGKGLMVYAPPAPPTVFRADFGFAPNYFVDGNEAFYSFTFQPPSPPQQAKVLEVFADGGTDEKYAYASATADDGRLVGTPGFLLFSAYDFSNTTGGVVRRIVRDGGTACNYGGTGNKRPFGIHADGKRIYWANQGDGPATPYTNGSLVSCDEATCCSTPDVMWTGNGQPAAVAGDAEAVYFTTYATGAVWKIAKP